MLYLRIAHFIAWRSTTNVSLPVSLCVKYMARGNFRDNMFLHSPGLLLLLLLLLLFTSSEFSPGGSTPYTSNK